MSSSSRGAARPPATPSTAEMAMPARIACAAARPASAWRLSPQRRATSAVVAIDRPMAIE